MSAALGSRILGGRHGWGLSSPASKRCCTQPGPARAPFLAPLQQRILPSRTPAMRIQAFTPSGGSPQPSFNPIEVVKREQGLQSNKWVLSMGATPGQGRLRTVTQL